MPASTVKGKNVALVTGANGFVGSKLCRYLSFIGWDVIGADRQASNFSKTLDYPLISCDISDRSSVDSVFSEHKSITHIFHLAAITFVPDSKRSPVTTMDINLNGTINVIESLKSNIPNGRMIFIGSSEVYGPPVDLPVTESHSFNPLHPYAISKLAADLYCGYEAGLGTDIVRVRPFNHSGSGQNPNFVLSDFCRQVVEIEAGLKEPVLKVGNLNAARDFSHVDDVVKAYYLIAEKGVRGAVYNVCSGSSVVIGDVLKQIIAHIDVEVLVEIDEEKFRPVDVPEIRGSNKLLTTELGWQPDKTLDNIICDLLQFWRNNI